MVFVRKLRLPASVKMRLLCMCTRTFQRACQQACQNKLKKATTGDIKFLHNLGAVVCDKGAQYNGQRWVSRCWDISGIPHIHPFKILKC